MKTALIVVAACAVVLATSLVIGQEQPPSSPPLPPGVLAHNWIPINDKFGFVVTPGAPSRDLETFPLETLNGYFLALHGDSWKRLDNQGDFRFQPLHK